MNESTTTPTTPPPTTTTPSPPTTPPSPPPPTTTPSPTTTTPSPPPTTTTTTTTTTIKDINNLIAQIIITTFKQHEMIAKQYSLIAKQRQTILHHYGKMLKERGKIVRHYGNTQQLCVKHLNNINQFFVALQKQTKPRIPRGPAVSKQRLLWENFVKKHATTYNFRLRMRMTIGSFDKLLAMVKPYLPVVDASQARKRGGEIIPEIKLYAAIRWLAGDSWSDITNFIGISKTAFYNIIWSTIDAINNTPDLEIKFPQTVEECMEASRGFRSIATKEVIDTCVCAVDGCHVEITDKTPSFFSKHHHSYGVNLQGACDHNSRFLFLDVAGPGSMADRDAIHECDLGNLIENLPELFCAISNSAYTPSEHMIPIFGGAQANIKANADFNVCASQCRNCIEKAFFHMRNQWAILTRPLGCHVANVRKIVICVARLHNFCIDERLAKT